MSLQYLQSNQLFTLCADILKIVVRIQWKKMDMKSPDRSWKAVNYRNTGNIIKYCCWQTYQISELKMVILGGNQSKKWILKMQNENDLEIIPFKDLPSSSYFNQISNPERMGNRVFFFIIIESFLFTKLQKNLGDIKKRILENKP